MLLFSKRQGYKSIRSVVESFVLKKCDQGWDVTKVEVRILLNWKDIVGRSFSEFSRPERVVFSRNNSGILYLLVKNGGYATLLQYAVPDIIERISTYFGFKVISAIKIRQ